MLAFQGLHTHTHSHTGSFINATLNGTMLTHVISTRFCLGQGAEVALVEARLKLFFSVCLPTVVQQQGAKFAWLIYYDRTLSQKHAAALQARLRPYAARGFRAVKSSHSRQYSLSAQAQLQFAEMWTTPPPLTTHLYISTRIDADDGLASGAVAELYLFSRLNLFSDAVFP